MQKAQQFEAPVIGGSLNGKTLRTALGNTTVRCPTGEVYTRRTFYQLQGKALIAKRTLFVLARMTDAEAMAILHRP
jgi:hypothetical protein